MASAREYHQRTKHSIASVQADRHGLDWANQPLPFKIYRGLAPLSLPRGLAPGAVPALTALATCRGAGHAPIDQRELARLLHLSAGILRSRRYPNGQVMYFRAPACTGALYHIDLYLVCGELPDLAAGVYHFGPHDFALRRLRDGDWRGALVEASGGAPSLATAPAVIVSTSTFWRNAWKYQARAYRHCYWDNGTMLAHLLALAAADDIAAEVVLGFDDAALNRLLGLDTEREVALSLVALGRGAIPPDSAPEPPPLHEDSEPLSAAVVDYPLIRAAHAATSLPSGAAARAWRAAGFGPTPVRPAAIAATPLRPPDPAPGATIDDAIARRRSARRFARTAIDFDAFSSILRAATRGVPFDCNGADCASLVEPYVIVHAVDGLAPGAYAFDVARAALEPLRHGDFRREAGMLDLGQELAADAAANVYLLADLARACATLGDRGYRAAQLEGGIVGGKLYLAAYALGLGATGLTFFDDEVTTFFSPHAAGKDVMFLVAIGNAARASR